MAQRHFFLTVICLTYLGLSVGACLTHQGHISKCQSCSKGHNKKLSYSQPNQLNHNAAQNAMVSTKMRWFHYPSAKAKVSSRVPISTPNAYGPSVIHYRIPETMSAPIDVYSEPYGYLRSVRSMGMNRLNSKAIDDFTESLPHDLNLRDDVIKSRVRRNGNGDIVSSTTHEPIESDTAPNWQDLINFFQSEKSSDVLKEHAEDRKSHQANQGIDNIDDLHDTISASDESSESSSEFFDRLSQRMPHLFQRLKSLHKLLVDSSSSEDVSDISNPFDADTYADSDHHFDETEMTDQLEKPEGGNASTKVLEPVTTSTEELTKESMKNHNVEASSTVTTLAAQNHEITAPNS